MTKQCVFISIFHPFLTKNILDSGVLDDLASRANVVIVVLKRKEQYFKELYERPGVFVEGVDAESFVKSRKNKLFTRISSWLIDTNTRKNWKMKNLEITERYIWYFFSISFTRIFAHIAPVQKFFRWLDYQVNNPRLFAPLFNKYRPTAVFATDLFADYDLLMLKNARLRGIKNIAMIRSWDNTTAIGYARFVPDELIVYNEIMKEQMFRYHHMGRESIHVTGIPHFERYLKIKPSSREEFCKNIGADPNKRLVLFAPAGNFFIDTDWQICEILKNLQTERKIPSDIQFIIRIHPFLPVDLKRFKPDKNFVIDITGPALANQNNKALAELDKGFLQHITDSLYYSSLVINTISSIIIDASIFDKPLITVDFNGWEKNVSFLRSIERWRMEENQIMWMSFGMTPRVKSGDELTLWINKYLKDLSIDREKRKIFRDAYCWKYDGESAVRISNIVMGFPLQN